VIECRFYDRFLASCKSQLPTMPYTMGVGFSCQKVDKVMMSDHDICLDRVIFPDAEET